MCGIAGYILSDVNASKKAKENLTRILAESQERGDDATGIAFVGKKVDEVEIIYVKAPLPSKQFVTCQEYLETMDTHDPMIVIGHTRQATKGNPSNNMNNHPIIVKSGIAMVHNGIISNDDVMFKTYELERDGEVDSEIIPKMVEWSKKCGFDTAKAVAFMASQVQGSMAVALIDKDEPDKLFMVRSSNPIAFAYERDTGTIYFASQESFLKKALIKENYIKGIFPNGDNEENYILKDFVSHLDDEGIVISKNGVEKYPIRRPGYASSVSTNSSSSLPVVYGSDRRKWNKQEKKKKYHVDMEEEDFFGELHAGFNPKDPIRRPKRYSTSELMARLDEIETYVFFGGHLPEAILADRRLEYRRIENCLVDRHAKIKELYKPRDVAELVPMTSSEVREYWADRASEPSDEELRALAEEREALEGDDSFPPPDREDTPEPTEAEVTQQFERELKKEKKIKKDKKAKKIDEPVENEVKARKEERADRVIQCGFGLPYSADHSGSSIEGDDDPMRGIGGA